MPFYLIQKILVAIVPPLIRLSTFVVKESASKRGGIRLQTLDASKHAVFQSAKQPGNMIHVGHDKGDTQDCYYIGVIWCAGASGAI